jgi:hypothetical protein
MPACKLFYCLFLLNLLKKEKKREKALLPAGVSKSAVRTVYVSALLEILTLIAHSTMQ